MISPRRVPFDQSKSKSSLTPASILPGELTKSLHPSQGSIHMQTQIPAIIVAACGPATWEDYGILDSPDSSEERAKLPSRLRHHHPSASSESSRCGFMSKVKYSAPQRFHE
ncbi:MAG: hypothetical protein NC095_07705 [Muribaculum sp.]|nr:hypothetical protein [Muribaculum sp.]